MASLSMRTISYKRLASNLVIPSSDPSSFPRAERALGDHHALPWLAFIDLVV